MDRQLIQDWHMQRVNIFKVVDSDDWVDEEALHKILMLMRHLEEDNEQIDMLISNYVYEK